VNGFKKYPHLERLGHVEVEDITIGTCHVFPKLDGTNASVWLDDGQVCGGSRNRTLSLGADNAGFLAWLEQAEHVRQFVHQNPGLRLYGEWLVPHTFKQYREDAWRKFWIFDVFDETSGQFLPFEQYAERMEGYFDLNVIEPLAVIEHPADEDLLRIVESNTYLVQDGAGPGEGVVVKRYGFENRFGNTTWAKIVRNAFKEDNRREFGVHTPGATYQVEVDIAQRFVTQHLVLKERAKLEIDGKLEKRQIPELFGRIWHCIITEEMWQILKDFKDPKIDFKQLRKYVIHYTKDFCPDLFN
jgi:hypothetical protein